MSIRVGPDVVSLHLDDHMLVCGLDARMDRDAGQGFFAADTRFVSGYRLRLGGVSPASLTATAVSVFGARFEFTNPLLMTRLGPVAADSLHLRLERSLGGGVHEDYDIVNYSKELVEFTLEVSLESDFGDIFEVRNRTVVRRGALQSKWDESEQRLTSTYRHDDFVRSLTTRVANADAAPEFANGGISFKIVLQPGAHWHSCLLWEPSAASFDLAAPARSCHSLVQGDHHTDDARQQWTDRAATFSTSELGPQRSVQQAMTDLAGLQLSRDHLAVGAPGAPTTVLADLDPAQRWVPAAGVPWYAALFGRDSLVVCLQTAALSPTFPVGSLLALSARQGDAYDDDRDMQPGKILHELRRGELAHFHLIPHTPYYGSHDATALFVLTAAEAWRWHGDRQVLDALRPHVDRALAWIDTDGDFDGDGLQEYATRVPGGGYYNQGWKDSGDAIVTEAGDIATLPLALCELQGYVIAAKRAWADVVDEVWNDTATATRLRCEADQLVELVEEKFWWEAEGTYVLGLDGSKRPIRSVASNAGHLLWSGAVDADRGRRTAQRLMEPDMWSGWGIRTLSADHPSYNPFSYHLGSVWPHDNAIIAAGMRRYVATEEAALVAGGILAATDRFKDSRPPELFSGLARDPHGFPVPYLDANVPQAWASGAIVHLLTTLLGITPDATAHRVVVDPALPDWLPDMTIDNLEVGDGAVRLEIVRQADGCHRIEVTPRHGVLQVSSPNSIVSMVVPS